MTVFRQLIQCIQDPAPQADKFFFFNSHFFRNHICRLKTNPPDIIGQAVRIFFNNIDAFAAIGLINFGGVGSADFVALQKKHDILDLFLVLPAFFDPVYADFSDSFYVKQGIRIFFDHIQCVLPEFLDNTLCKFGPYAFYQTGTEILFYSVNRGRKRLFKFFHGELFSVLGVHFPETIQRQYGANMGIRHGAYDRYQVMIILYCTFQYGITIVCILICDPFHHTPQMFHGLRLLCTMVVFHMPILLHL